ncbi:lipase family protein [Vibrio coralliilyticus]|uniref:lipase family protein n=1 Tax=Vibrio coralliilyticus TaxID=190893 RepID=UPI0039174318
MKNKFSGALLATTLLLAAGCSSVKHEKGAIWCNEPLKYTPNTTHFDRTHIEVARRGYIYALAGAFVLQTNSDESKDHWFELPERMTVVDKPERHKSGFEVGTFELREEITDAKPSEVIIAFTGSNDKADWVWTNIWFSQTQYDLASEYLKKVHSEYPNTRIVVTGYSLGGALAGHVTKEEKTSALVDEAWLFNPSPKLYANDNYDERIWVGAVRGEALQYVRTWPFETFWPGINKIGAPWQQNAQDYYLISAFPVYGHYRWTLVRNILFVADYAHLQNENYGPVDPKRVREPREIIEASYFKACEAEQAERNRILTSQKGEQEKVTNSLKEEQAESRKL